MLKMKTLIVVLMVSIPTLCQGDPIITEFAQDGTIGNGDIYDIVNVVNTATVGMTGGQVNQLNARNYATINFYGGTVLQGIGIQNTSKFNLAGNLTVSNSYWFWMHDSAEFHINSGTFDGRISESDGRIVVNNGSVNFGESYTTNHAIMDLYGGTVTFTDDILLDRYAVLNVYGGDVTFNGNSFGNAFRLGPWAVFNVYYSNIIYDGIGNHIIGYHLQDGSEFMLNQFTQNEISQIKFVPEPTMFVLLGLGGLILRKLH